MRTSVLNSTIDLNGRCFWIASASAGVRPGTAASSAAVAVLGLSRGGAGIATGAAAPAIAGPAMAKAARSTMAVLRVIIRSLVLGRRRRVDMWQRFIAAAN